MAILVVEFLSGGTKLKMFLCKNQHTQRNLLNFELWINGKLSKRWIIKKGHLKVDFVKKVNNKKCAPKLVFFNEKN